MTKSRKTFWTDFRQFFLRGLGILLPSVLTLALLWWAYGFLRNNVAEPINSAVREVVIFTAPRIVDDRRLPEWFTVTDEQVARLRDERSRLGQPRVSDDHLRADARAKIFAEWWRSHWYLEAIGFVIAVVLVYLAGVLVGNFVGKRVWQRVEGFLTSLPVLKQVYPSVKQVVEFLMGGGFGGGEGGQAVPAGKVVLVQFPRPGCWMVGLMSGRSMQAIERLGGNVEHVSIFMPTSPTPFTGFAISVPRKEIIEVDMSLDEAIRYLVSGGVLIPPRMRAAQEPEILIAPQAAGAERPSDPTKPWAGAGPAAA